MGDERYVRQPDLIIDGEDLGCGELLLRLARPLREQPPGALVRLIATDPAAPTDLPAWCRLGGHRYLGAGREPDDRPSFDIVLAPLRAPIRA